MSRAQKNNGCTFLVLLLAVTRAASGTEAASSDSHREDWLQLFNGRDLTGWTPKIKGHALGDNFANTFRVEDDLLQVRYDQYDSFGTQFGHLFFERPFSYYRLVVEYRFVGEQPKGAPGSWALRNSGVMLQAQDPRQMRREQAFPISIEAQFLGGNGDGKARPTLNMCSPGTEVVVDGRVYPEHCLSSTSATFDGEQWVRAEILVLGAGPITHFVNGQKVLEYALAQIGGEMVGGDDDIAKPDGRLLEGGYIALQSESHPIDFRTVALLNLEGCMDRSAINYKDYYVKSDPKACRYKETTDWTALFNGHDFDGWRHVGDGEFLVENGVLRTRGGLGLLWYAREKFENARLRIVYRVPNPKAGGNSGVFIRIPENPNDPWEAVNRGYEVQIDDGGDPFHRTGTLYSFTKARETAPAREWNTMEITLEGARTTVVVNGRTITDHCEGDPVSPKKESYEPERGPRPVSGYIGLQNHGEADTVLFREISVKKLR